LRILPDKDLFLLKPKFGRQAHGLTSPIAKNFGGTAHASLLGIYQSISHHRQSFGSPLTLCASLRRKDLVF
jgi:hypothetical protein